MNTVSDTEVDYQEKIKQEISANLRNFIVGSFVAFVAFIFLISRIPTKQLTKSLNLPQKLEGIDASTETSDIAKRLQGDTSAKAFKVPTKNPSPKDGLVIEAGQISAIKTGPVTYKKNTYIVQPGDSLATIAEQTYGDSNAWTIIAKANNLSSPDQIEVGMELKIPR